VVRATHWGRIGSWSAIRVKPWRAHSTLNRLELSAQCIDPRYNKFQVQPEQTEDLLIKRAVKAIPRKSAEIVLDFDATDDPLHGSQEGGYFNGYYRHYCYLPFAVIFPFLPSCEIANVMRAAAPLSPSKDRACHSQAFWQQSEYHRAGR
jgi:hypothetical protein